MNTSFHFSVAIALGLSLLAFDKADARNQQMCIVSESGIAPVRLGMALDEAKRAMPNAQFQRATDGDGAAMITVAHGNEDVMTLFANEEDPDSAIDWSRKISAIETFNPSCRTVAGAYPGMPIKKAETIYGKAKEIVRSEIESREYIEFENQPAHLLFRIDYTGIFTEGLRRAKKYEPDGRIFSIAVMPR